MSPTREPDDDWLTYAQAAKSLGCGDRNVPKLVTNGHLLTHFQLYGWRRKAGTVRRADVEHLVELRRKTQLDLASRAAEAAARHEPPDDEHEWISIREAARQLGRTDKAVLARIQRDRLPATRVGRRWWIRQDQLTLIEAGRLGSKTKRI